MTQGSDDTLMYLAHPKADGLPYLFSKDEEYLHQMMDWSVELRNEHGVETTKKWKPTRWNALFQKKRSKLYEYQS